LGIGTSLQGFYVMDLIEVEKPDDVTSRFLQCDTVADT
jgi:hypothetical protein